MGERAQKEQFEQIQSDWDGWRKNTWSSAHSRVQAQRENVTPSRIGTYCSACICTREWDGRIVKVKSRYVVCVEAKTCLSEMR